LPPKGYRVITVPEWLYDRLAVLKTLKGYRSLSKVIEELLK